MIKELREKRTKLVKDSRSFLERVEGENRAFNAEEDKQWEVMNAEITNLGVRIDRLHRLEEQEKSLSVVVCHGLGQGGSTVDGKSIGGDMPGMRQAEAWNVLLNAWSRAEKGVRTPKKVANRIREAVKVCGFNPTNRRILIPLERDYDNLRNQMFARRIRNAAESVGTSANGGYTIPQGFVNALEEALLWFGPMMQVADVMRTATGNPLPWPTTHDL